MAPVLALVLLLVSVALALLLYSLLPESTAAAVSSRLDPSIVAAIAHEDALHGAHVFVGVDQWTDGNNELCERETSGDGDEPEPTDPTMRCPVGCEEPAVQQGRVRRALNTLSDDEWSRVVAALRTMQEVPTAEGVARFGGAYRDYSFHAVFHAMAAKGNHLPDGTNYDTDMTGGGPQQPTWHALELLMFENSLLAVDPSIVALPYLDWSAMDAEAYDRYFGTGSGGTPDDCEEGDGVYLVDSGPFALWPVPRWSWREWYGEQIDEVKELLAEVDAFWDNASAWIELSGVNTTLEQLLALTGDQLRSNEHTSTPYLVRGRVGDDFWQAMTRVDWAAAVAECTSDALGWHNEFEACLEGRLTTQAIHDADGNPVDVGSAKAFDEAPAGVLVHDMHLVPHYAVGGLEGDMVDTLASGWEPFFWFHHAGIDKLRRSWQHNNERLRPWAYGYPVRSGYNYTPTGLYDCLGCGAYGLGFDGEHLEELGRRRGNASAADVLCGRIDTLYTYDSVLRATRDAATAQVRRHANAGLAGGTLLVLSALLVLRRTRLRKATGGRGVVMVGESGWDMRINESAAHAGRRV